MTLTTHWLWQKVKCRYNLWPQSNIRNTSKVYLTFSFYLEVISYKNMIFLTGDYDPFLTLSLIKEWQILSQNLITVVCWNLSAWFGHNTKYKLREWLPSVFIPSGHVGGGRRIDAEHARSVWCLGRRDALFHDGFRLLRGRAVSIFEDPRCVGTRRKQKSWVLCLKGTPSVWGRLYCASLEWRFLCSPPSRPFSVLFTTLIPANQLPCIVSFLKNDFLHLMIKIWFSYKAPNIIYSEELRKCPRSLRCDRVTRWAWPLTSSITVFRLHVLALSSLNIRQILFSGLQIYLHLPVDYLHLDVPPAPQMQALQHGTLYPFPILHFVSSLWSNLQAVGM